MFTKSEIFQKGDMKNENIYTIYTDGGSRGNPGEAAYGFVIKDSNSQLVYSEGKRLGITTNNVAEYMGVVTAIKWVKEHLSLNGAAIHFFMDSQLVAYQLQGKYKIKNENLRNLYFTIRETEQKCGCNITYTPIPREQNTEADRLVNMALDGE